jgi:hypothetical protein
VYSVSQIDLQQRDRFLRTHNTPLGTILLATVAWAQSSVNPNDAEAACRPQIIHAEVPPIALAVHTTGTVKVQITVEKGAVAMPKSTRSLSTIPTAWYRVREGGSLTREFMPPLWLSMSTASRETEAGDLVKR